MIFSHVQSSAPVSVTIHPAEGAPFTVHRAPFRATLFIYPFVYPLSILLIYPLARPHAVTAALVSLDAAFKSCAAAMSAAKDCVPQNRNDGCKEHFRYGAFPYPQAHPVHPRTHHSKHSHTATHSSPSWPNQPTKRGCRYLPV
eukprot:363533-Chlamydomonas_euryale.AAC.2